MKHKSIYLASMEADAGTLVITIGIMEMLKGHYKRVAFFRPILPNTTQEEHTIALMRTHFELDITYAQCCGFSVEEYIDAYGSNQEERLHEALIQKVEKLHQAYDFVLIVGYPRSLFGALFDFDINFKIAKNLGTLFLPILNAHQKSSHTIIDEIEIVSEALDEEGCALLAILINRCSTEHLTTLKHYLLSQKFDPTINLLPEVKELNTPTLDEVTQSVEAKMLLGSAPQLQHLVYGNTIAAMGVEHYLTQIENGDIVIVPGDRIDIILASLLSFYAKNHANIAGIILSEGITLTQPIIALLEDFSHVTPPLFTTPLESYQVAIAIEKISPRITPENKRKITLAKGLFHTHVDREKMLRRCRTASNHTLTPMMFAYRLFEQAHAKRERIVLPESSDIRILQATEILLQRGIADIILLGNPQKIHQQAAKMDLDIHKAAIIDPQDQKLQEEFAQILYAMRKEKGLSLDQAKDTMRDSNHFATMMVHTKMADGIVSGAANTTAETITPALQIIKTKAKLSLVSSIFFMCLETKVLVYGDCAVNMDPTAPELAQIAISSADTAKAFGIEPKVALLSYSTGSSGSGPDVEKVREATRLAQSMRPEYLIEGPIQYDAAIDPNVAKSKLPQSHLAGEASVFIFPDLNTGNNTYKAVQRSTNSLAIGPILQGLRLPVNDLSRGCTVEDIVNTVAITAIQAQKAEQA